MKYSTIHTSVRDVATSKLASDPSSGSKKPEPDNSGSTSEIYSWASQLASESRKLGWVFYWYVWPDAVREVIHKLETMSGGIIGLVGLQGVGKSSALQAILKKRIAQADRQWQESGKKGPVPRHTYRIVLFKWRRESELFRSLLNGSHEAYESFLSEYLPELLERSSTTHAPHAPASSSRSRLRYKLSLLELETKALTSRLAAEKDPRFYASGAALEEVDRLERKFDKATLGKLRQSAWLRMLRRSETILIDTPDYSKTDRRVMAKDLQEIYWLWNTLASSSSPSIPPKIILAVQKEMFRDHFFFDKMEKVELEPLKPEQMVEAYRKRFKAIEPFTEDALFALARMSRGIFRRFLRYITLALQYSESHGKKIIRTETVKQAVTVERLAEDMELELVELFPKQSDLRLQAVRQLMHLGESGPKKQSELVEELGLEAYVMSRLLAKLELHRYIARRREGTDKIVTLRNEM
jgi:hypothetical protein